MECQCFDSEHHRGEHETPAGDEVGVVDLELVEATTGKNFLPLEIEVDGA